jgi:hypothetical protein
MSDFTLTIEQVAAQNAAHGGMAPSGDTLGLIMHGAHTVELMDAQGNADGWQQIRRDTVTGLCSRSDLRAALGY